MMNQAQRDDLKTIALDRLQPSGRKGSANYSLKMRPVIVKDLSMF